MLAGTVPSPGYTNPTQCTNLTTAVTTNRLCLGEEKEGRGKDNSGGTRCGGVLVVGGGHKH